MDDVTTDQARELVARVLVDAPVFDGHNDLAWQMRVLHGYDLAGFDLGRHQPELHTDLPRLRAGGVGAQFWSVYVPCHLDGDNAVTATLEQIDFVYRFAARYPDRLRLARTADEVEAARRDGLIACLLGVEGGHSINGSPGVLRMMAELGVRYLTLTHGSNTPWADSATDEPAVGGLSDFGRDVVRECNRLGVLVDLSHVAPQTMHAALDVSDAPAFFSHSSARAVCDHVRNVPDDVLARVAASNGIVMVTFVPGFLTKAAREWMERLVEAEGRIGAPEDSPLWRSQQHRWVRDNPPPPCTVDDVADHVEHVREVAGVAHVGLGGDFDGIVVTPDGLPDVSAYPNLLAVLAQRGWSGADLAKLTWHNAVRVLRDSPPSG